MTKVTCGARLSLILPGEDEECEVIICTKRQGHDSHHGDLSGYAWREYAEESR